MGLLSRFKKNKDKKDSATSQPPPPQPLPPQPPLPEEKQAAQKQEIQQTPAVQPRGKPASTTVPQPKNEIENKQNTTLEAITLKKKQIDNITKVLKKTEEERAKQAKLAIDAKNRKKLQEATRHAKQAARLKTRIENLDNQLNLLNEQLFALEDAGVFLQTNQELQTGTEVLKKVVVDEDELDATLAENREQLDAANAVGQALKVDVNLYGDHEDAEGLLDDLENEFADDIKTEISKQIPDVPTGKPKPVVASSSSETPDSAQVKSLESQIAPKAPTAGPSSPIEDKSMDEITQLEGEVQT